jgi:hypothetical protein
MDMPYLWLMLSFGRKEVADASSIIVLKRSTI